MLKRSTFLGIMMIDILMLIFIWAQNFSNGKLNKFLCIIFHETSSDREGYKNV